MASIGFPRMKAASFDNKRISRSCWEQLIHKVHHKLQHWQAKHFSLAGRITLVNHVLLAIPGYHSGMFLLPTWVTDSINRICKGFIWTGKKETNNIKHLVNWSKVCQLKEFGGLGVKDLAEHNRALLCKWWWQLLSDNEKPWKPIVKYLYLRNRHWSEIQPDAKWSHVWKSVYKLLPFVDVSIAYEVGNGERINFWMDRWLGESKLCTVYKDLSNNETEKTLAQALSRDATECTAPTNIIPASHLEEFLKIWDTSLEENKLDQCIWRWNNNKKFTVTSAYKMLKNGGVSSLLYKCIWCSIAPQKLQIHCWLAIEEKLNTRVNLIKKGLQVDIHCPRCKVVAETANHCLINCQDIKELWVSLLNAANIDLPYLSLESLIQSKPSGNICSSSIWRGIIQAGFFTLWKSRNAIVFQDEQWPLQLLKLKWLEEIKIWTSFHQHQHQQQQVHCVVQLLSVSFAV